MRWAWGLFWRGSILVSFGLFDRHATRWCAGHRGLFDHVVDRANGIKVNRVKIEKSRSEAPARLLFW